MTSHKLQAAQLGKDGQHSIKRRLALFWSKEADPNPEVFVYVRSVAVHSVMLSAEQVSQEHGGL